MSRYYPYSIMMMMLSILLNDINQALIEFEHIHWFSFYAFTCWSCCNLLHCCSNHGFKLLFFFTNGHIILLIIITFCLLLICNLIWLHLYSSFRHDKTIADLYFKNRFYFHRHEIKFHKFTDIEENKRILRSTNSIGSLLANASSCVASVPIRLVMHL